MAKKQEKDNKLNIIKKNAMLKLMKEKGITRVNPNALKIFNEHISENTKNLIYKLRQNLQIKAKKTLEEQDVLDILKDKTILENYNI